MAEQGSSPLQHGLPPDAAIQQSAHERRRRQSPSLPHGRHKALRAAWGVGQMGAGTVRASRAPTVPQLSSCGLSVGAASGSGSPLCERHISVSPNQLQPTLYIDALGSTISMVKSERAHVTTPSCDQSRRKGHMRVGSECRRAGLPLQHAATCVRASSRLRAGVRTAARLASGATGHALGCARGPPLCAPF